MKSKDLLRCKASGLKCLNVHTDNVNLDKHGLYDYERLELKKPQLGLVANSV